MTIYFYTKLDEYGEFSNFSNHGVELDGLWWPTVEHYFQVQKFQNTEYQERIRNASSPKQAAELGRSRKLPIRDDWESVKDELMYQAVLKKIETQNDSRPAAFNGGTGYRRKCTR
jgi:N-glycosidase YbiA